MIQTIETHIQQNSVHGMCFAFIAGILGNLQTIPPNPTTFETTCKVIAQISIIIGFLIAVITLIIKCKELYTTFFVPDKPAKRRKAVSSRKED